MVIVVVMRMSSVDLRGPPWTSDGLFVRGLVLVVVMGMCMPMDHVETVATDPMPCMPSWWLHIARPARQLIVIAIVIVMK